MQLETAIRDIVRQTVSELVSLDGPVAPEFITIEDARQLCDCDRTVIDSLIRESNTNGFPSIRLSERVIRIDKRRLFSWLNSGGLNGVYQETR